MDQAVRDEIVKTKRALGAGSPALKDAFRRAEDRIRRESDLVQKEVAAGRSPLPEVDFSAVKEGRVADGARERDPQARLRRHPRRLPCGSGPGMERGARPLYRR